MVEAHHNVRHQDRMTRRMKTRSLTEQFVEQILAVEYGSLPKEAIDMAKQVTLDGLAVMLAGATEPLGVGIVSVDREVARRGGIAVIEIVQLLSDPLQAEGVAVPVPATARTRLCLNNDEAPKRDRTGGCNC